jgi:ATP-dependent Lon protease
MDRMEIIRIAGYTEDEKIEIARRHLIPAQTKAHGLEAEEWSLDDDALKEVIRRYTREAGVRNLEREIAKMSRKSVKELLTTKKKSIQVTLKNLEDYLGVPKFRYGEAELEDQVGVVTGLAWTEVGGELLTVEGVMMPGKGKMTVTGNRHQAASVRKARHPRARAGGCNSEGRAVRRRRHGDRHRLDDDRNPGEARRRHDR